jgi:surface polysaccharide O-acyltransferase-like enzyme
MEELKQKASFSTLPPEPNLASFPVDLIRTVAIFLVILLHVSIQHVTVQSPTSWLAFDLYNSIARPCVPLFVMLTGYLMLQPSKVNEPLKIFFKKRWARIGLPFIFWGVVYFVWVYLIDNGSLSFNSVVQGMLQGPYVTFWFLYLLVGLYLLTPILRVFIAYASDNVMKFLLLIWFVGTGLMPLVALFGFVLNNNVFILPGWIGYFLLGAYLPKLKTKMRPWRLYVLMAVGFAWTMIGSAFMAMNSWSQLYFFYDYLAANVIVASASMFLLLTSISTQSFESKPARMKKLIHLIGQNTLPIYLFHMILVEAFEKGLFGFTLTIMVANPLITVPFITFLILFLSLAIIVPLKKIPVFKQLLG